MDCPACNSKDVAFCWCTTYDYQCLACGARYHRCRAMPGHALVVLPFNETKYFRCPGNHQAHLNEKLRSEMDADERLQGAERAVTYHPTQEETTRKYQEDLLRDSD